MTNRLTDDLVDGARTGDDVALGAWAKRLQGAEKIIEQRNVEIVSLKDANDRLQARRDQLEAEVKSNQQIIAGHVREIDRLRHQTGEARKSSATACNVDEILHDNIMLRAALKHLAGLI